jgi:glucose-6-phosphate isomerase
MALLRNMSYLYDLGGQFFLWEMATAVAGHLLDIQPFDQPDIESAKILPLPSHCPARPFGCRLPF